MSVLFLLGGELYLVYSAKPLFKITLVNAAEGGKFEVWIDSGKEEAGLFSLVAFAVPQTMRDAETAFWEPQLD